LSINSTVSEGRGYRLSSAADKTMKFLKNLSNKTNANIILIGDETSKVLFNNSNYRRRFSKIFRMPLLKRGQIFQGVLKKMERFLPLKNTSNLSDIDIAKYIFELTKGQIMGIQILVRDAAITAIETGTERITKELIAQHADKVIEMASYSEEQLKSMGAYVCEEKYENTIEKPKIQIQLNKPRIILPDPAYSMANLLI